MSEKRFEVDVDYLLLVWDTERNKRLEIEDIVDLLNEFETKCYNLEKENENLESNIRFFKNQLDELKRKYERCDV